MNNFKDYIIFRLSIYLLFVYFNKKTLTDLVPSNITETGTEHTPLLCTAHSSLYVFLFVGVYKLIVDYVRINRS